MITWIKITLCLAGISGSLTAHVQRQNHLNALRCQLPLVQRQLRAAQEETRRLRYEIDHISSPQKLLRTAHQSRYSHLQRPNPEDVWIIAPRF